MRSFVSALLIALVVSSTINASLVAAAKPLGTVIAAENAHLGDAALTLGTNVFSGDFLQTDFNGAIRLRAGSTQMYLAAGSAAVIQRISDQLPDRFGANLVHGGWVSPPRCLTLSR